MKRTKRIAFGTEGTLDERAALVERFYIVTARGLDLYKLAEQVGASGWQCKCGTMNGPVDLICVGCLEPIGHCNPGPVFEKDDRDQ